MHGYYIRYLKNTKGETLLSILRIKCKSCNKTHALLHPSIVPFSQIPLSDTIDIIINHDEGSNNIDVMNNNPEITESDVMYTINKYLKHWKKQF